MHHRLKIMYLGIVLTKKVETSTVQTIEPRGGNERTSEHGREPLLGWEEHVQTAILPKATHTPYSLFSDTSNVPHRANKHEVHVAAETAATLTRRSGAGGFANSGQGDCKAWCRRNMDMQTNGTGQRRWTATHLQPLTCDHGTQMYTEKNSLCSGWGREHWIPLWRAWLHPVSQPVPCTQVEMGQRSRYTSSKTEMLEKHLKPPAQAQTP